MAKGRPARTKAASGPKDAKGRAKTRRKQSSAAGAGGSSARRVTKQGKAGSRTAATRKKKTKKKTKKRKTVKQSPEATVASPGPPVQPAQEHTVTDDPGTGKTADRASIADSPAGPAPSTEDVAASDPFVDPLAIDPVEASETIPTEPKDVLDADAKSFPAAADLDAFFESLIRDIDDLERSVVADPLSEPPEPADVSGGGHPDTAASPPAMSGHASRMPVIDEALDQFSELSKTIDDIALEPVLEAQPDGVGQSPASVPVPARPPVDVEAPGRSAPVAPPDAQTVEIESPVETQFDDAGSSMSSTSLVETADTELAGEIENLLEGDFESVEQMLEVNQDELAADVATAGVPDQPAPDLQQSSGGLDSAVEMAGSDQPLNAQPEELKEEWPAPQTPGLVEESDPEAPKAGEQERQGGPAAQRAADQERQGRRDAAPPASPSVTVLPEHLPPALGAGDKRTLDSVVEPMAGTPVGLEPSTLWARVEPGVGALFEWVNYPMRFLPQSGRPVINWLALSLLLWAPIVWLIALLVVGR